MLVEKVWLPFMTRHAPHFGQGPSTQTSDEPQKRLAILQNLKPLDVTHEAEELVVEIMAAGMLPPKAVRDAAHVAVAAVYEMNYLLTWNCKHLANAQIARRVSLTCQQHGYRMPIICTPEELMGE